MDFRRISLRRPATATGLLLLAALLSTTLPLTARSTPPLASDAITLKTLYWPPYTGEMLDGQGFLAADVQQKLAENGFQVTTEFVPWTSILANAEHQFQPMDAFFPAYNSHRYLDFCELSSPIGNGPLGIIHHKRRTPQWQHISDLNQLSLGVVRGYANTEEIDALIRLGALQTEAAKSDLQNIIKVATGRIDAAIIDRNVYQWLLANEPSIEGIEELIRFHPKLLAQQDLHLCVLKGPHQEKILEIFR